MRYFQLLLLDPVEPELELSVLVLSLVDLKLPRLSVDSGHDAVSSTERREATVRQCNHTVVHLLQWCGGLLHLEFGREQENRISSLRDPLGDDMRKVQGRVPTQVKSLAEGDYLHIQFLHRTVFDYLRELLKTGESLAFQTCHSSTLWSPAVARAEALIRKIRIMVDAVDVPDGPKKKYITSRLKWVHLEVSVAAVREIEQLTSLPQEELLLKLEFQGAELMKFITEKCHFGARHSLV